MVDVYGMRRIGHSANDFTEDGGEDGCVFPHCDCYFPYCGVPYDGISAGLLFGRADRWGGVHAGPQVIRGQRSEDE